MKLDKSEIIAIWNASESTDYRASTSDGKYIGVTAKATTDCVWQDVSNQ
jgi:hypothetical protein